VFDGDDTLWFVEPLYDQARSEAAAIVAAAWWSPSGNYEVALIDWLLVLVTLTYRIAEDVIAPATA